MDGNHLGMKITLILLALVGIAVLVAIVAAVIISLIVFLGGWFPRLGKRSVTKEKDNRQISKMKEQVSKPDRLGTQH